MFSFLIPSALLLIFFFFFFNDTATTEIYTLSLHDALPIWTRFGGMTDDDSQPRARWKGWKWLPRDIRSEEHTSELQSHVNLVCRLLLEKKKKKTKKKTNKKNKKRKKQTCNIKLKL